MKIWLSVLTYVMLTIPAILNAQVAGDTFNVKAKHFVYDTPKYTPRSTAPIVYGNSSLVGVYTRLEKMPEFKGGEPALLKFIKSNIRYPQTELKNNVQGRVIVQFVVRENGNVDNDSVRVLRGISTGLDKEAVRIVKLLPPFEPASNKGKPVSFTYKLPVEFKLP